MFDAPPMLMELSVAEQRYQAVLAVIADGRAVSEVAGAWSVSRQTVHGWLARYETSGLDGLSDRSHRPRVCPHQMPATVEVAVLAMRRARQARCSNHFPFDRQGSHACAASGQVPAARSMQA